MKKTILIKFGGSLFTNENNRKQFWQDVKNLKQDGANVVIVHGGGKEISSWIEKVGSEVKFVNGLRYTDEEIMNIVEMVLSGLVNKQLVTEFGENCLGISCRDSNIIIADQVKELGLVGKPFKTNISIIEKLLDAGITPIISPVSSDKNGQHLNVNADDAANALAIALKADALVFMTDMEGVLDDKKMVISVLDKKLAEDYKASGVINGGMIPKIDSAFLAIAQGVKMVNIVGSILSEQGTKIV